MKKILINFAFWLLKKCGYLLPEDYEWHVKMNKHMEVKTTNIRYPTRITGQVAIDIPPIDRMIPGNEENVAFEEKVVLEKLYTEIEKEVRQFIKLDKFQLQGHPEKQYLRGKLLVYKQE